MNKQRIESLLRKFTLFKDLSDLEIEPIISLTKFRTYQKGAHIFFQDDPMENVYFINSGKVKIYRTDIHGKEQIINVLKSGNMFPHQGFFQKNNYPAHALVFEKAMLAYIPVQDFQKVLIEHPEICMKLLHVLSKIIRELQTRLEDKIMFDTREQIIKLLLRLAKTHGKPIDDGKICFTTQFTNQELANMIGSSRESVSRTLSSLRSKNMIENDSSGQMIINYHQLHEEIIN